MDSFSIADGDCLGKKLYRRRNRSLESAKPKYNPNTTRSIPLPMIISVNNQSLHSPIIALPYDLNDKDEIGWIFVEPREKWNTIFRDLMVELTPSN